MHRLSPHLVCDGAADAIDFYVAAFGAQELMRLPGENGRLMHAAISVNGSSVMLVDEDRSYGLLSPKTLGGSPVTIHLIVPDADAAFDRAVAAGATARMPVAEMFWGDRYGVLEDPFGHRLVPGDPAGRTAHRRGSGGRRGRPVKRPEIEVAARRLAAVVSAVDDAELAGPTPCADFTVAALLDHIDGFVAAFTAVGTKTRTGDDGPPAPADASHLRGDWRSGLPDGLDALIEAWRADDAYAGTASAGGFELPADAVAVIAIEEMVVHGWDLARATGQAYECTAAELAVVDEFFGQFGPEQRSGAYEPAREVGVSASHLGRVIAESGRDPAWTSVSVSP